jgi:hypothetical protein
MADLRVTIRPTVRSQRELSSSPSARLALLLLRILVLRILDVLFDRFFRIAIGLLRRARNFLRQPFGLLLLAAHGLANTFLHLTGGFLDATFDLIFVNAHEKPPAIEPAKAADTPHWST